MSKEHISVIIGLVIFLYSFLSIMIFHTLFKYYLWIPTFILIVIFSYYFPIKREKSYEILDICFKFSSSMVCIVITLFTFVLIAGRELITNYYSNAFYSIGWLIICIFGTFFSSLIGKNIYNEEINNILIKSSIFLLTFSFIILVSLIGGIAFAL